MASEQEDTQIFTAAKPKAKKTRRRRERRRGVAVESDPGAPVEVLEVYGTVTGSGKAVSAERVKSSVLDALS